MDKKELKDEKLDNVSGGTCINFDPKGLPDDMLEQIFNIGDYVEYKTDGRYASAPFVVLDRRQGIDGKYVYDIRNANMTVGGNKDVPGSMLKLSSYGK